MTKTFQEFLTAKSIEQEVFDNKSAEEKAGLYNEYNKELKTYIEELDSKVKDSASKEELAKAIKQLQDNQVEQMKELNSALKEMGLSIKANTEKAKKDNSKSIKSELVSNLDKLKSLSSHDKETVHGSEFTIKAPADMLLSTNVSGGNIPVEDRLTGVNLIPTRRVRLLDLVSQGTTQSNIVSWVYQANQDGSANYTTEGAVKNKIDFDLIVASEKVQKITAFIKVSDEMMSDIDFIDSLIQLELRKELLKKVETEVYAGAGGANALSGIRTLATAFTAGSFANTIDNANEVDVLTVAMNQIMIAEHDGATAILMHPSDVTSLKMVKVSATDKRYVERLAMVAGELSLDGTPIIPSTLVTRGEYLVAEFALDMLLNREAVTIQVGLDGNDFTKNMRTILAEWRGVNIIKNNDRTAFVKGVFATDKASLETA